MYDTSISLSFSASNLLFLPSPYSLSSLLLALCCALSLSLPPVTDALFLAVYKPSLTFVFHSVVLALLTTFPFTFTSTYCSSLFVLFYLFILFIPLPISALQFSSSVFHLPRRHFPVTLHVFHFSSFYSNVSLHSLHWCYFSKARFWSLDPLSSRFCHLWRPFFYFCTILHFIYFSSISIIVLLVITTSRTTRTIIIIS